VSALTFVLLALAAYRVTRLVVLDDLTRPLRLSIEERHPAAASLAPGPAPRPYWLVVLVNCPWCVGAWVCLAGALLLRALGLIDTWSLVVLAWLAASTVVGLLSRLEA
jgi:hypothetical protein